MIDADTKQPLEDVIVVVQWELDRGGFHPGLGGRMRLEETITDKAGRFFFAAWGPAKPDEGFLRDSTPYLLLYKQGYVPKGLRNDVNPYGGVPDVWRSKWDGTAIELQRFDGDVQRYSIGLHSVRFLYGSSYRDPCAWELMPRITAEALKLGKWCRHQEAHCGMPDMDTLRWGGRCKSPDVVLRDYLS